MDGLAVVRVALWFIAGVISFYFSIGNARIWTSISTGFLLVFISEAYPLAPWVDHPNLIALHSVIGTIAILVLTHGFQEYYVFSRTLEAGGSKKAVYLSTAAVILGSGLILMLNPVPNAATLRSIRMIENANWVFLSLISLDMIRKIYVQIRETPIASGFIGFAVAFGLAFVWRGTVLYLQVYGWDTQGVAIMGTLAEADAREHASSVAFANVLHNAAGILSSLTVGGTFVYLYRVLR